MKKNVAKKIVTPTAPTSAPKTEMVEKKTNTKTVKKTVEPDAVKEVMPVETKAEDVDKTSEDIIEKALGDTLINELTDKIGSVQLELKSIQQTLKLLVKEYNKHKKSNC